MKKRFKPAAGWSESFINSIAEASSRIGIFNMRPELDDGFYQCSLFISVDKMVVGSFLVFDSEIFYVCRYDRRIQLFIPPGVASKITAELIIAAHFEQIDFMRIIFYPENDSLPIN